MKLLRFGEFGKEKPGIIDKDGKIRDLSSHITDINGETITSENLKKISTIDLSSLPIVPNNTRLGACVGNIGKFLCIGLNYSENFPLVDGISKSDYELFYNSMSPEIKKKIVSAENLGIQWIETRIELEKKIYKHAGKEFNINSFQISKI